MNGCQHLVWPALAEALVGVQAEGKLGWGGTVEAGPAAAREEGRARAAELRASPEGSTAMGWEERAEMAAVAVRVPT